MKCKLLLCLLFISTAAIAQQVTFSGYIREAGSRELLPGVSVYLKNQTAGVSSNHYGFFSLTLPRQDSVTLVFSFVGYGKQEFRKPATSNQQFNVLLEPANTLREVVVNAERKNQRISDDIQMSSIQLPVSQAKKIPAFLGEKDVLKVLQLMPGVQKGTEGQAGIYVRGGGPDQNLLILDDATVYNANHLFGFFSVFNGDALKSVELIKGGFPSRYGGRLSSVIDMQMKDGNKEKLSGEGGIGLISSRLTLEGPIGNRKKASFLISGRRTYLDILAKPFIRRAIENDGGEGSAGYYFQDLNLKLNYDFSQKDKIYLSGFFGKDKFKLNTLNDSFEEIAGLQWANKTGTLRWNHLYSPKLFSNTSLIFSNFNFGINNQLIEYNENGENVSDFSLDYSSGIDDIGLKTDFDFYPNANHEIKFGLQFTRHIFSPTAYVVNGNDGETDINIKPQRLKSLESGLYAEDVWTLNNKAKLNFGLRYSNFNTETENYGRIEPRLSLAYKIAPDLSLKASYAIMNQYIHLLTNTGIGLPTDLWVPTTDRVAPQRSEQIAAGIAKDLGNSGFTLSLEGYYKDMQNIISYKEGASFLELDGNANSFNDWQDNITSGRGNSYGAEFLLHKKTGRFSGWAGYTLSWTNWQFEELNNGKKFFPKYDRRHDISLVGIYEVNDRISVSGVWVYGTGNALTMPLASFRIRIPTANLNNDINRNVLPQYADYGSRNSFRAESYHRLDLSIQFHKQKKRHERTWEFGVVNAYNRRNPFFYQTEIQTDPAKGERTVLKRISLFPVIPSFTYNFKF